jgi:enoyl-CoA hydratase/carnithine racemase
VAKELTMTGRIISGKQAEQLGLVTRCVDDPMDEAMKVAKEIIRKKLRYSKRVCLVPDSPLRFSVPSAKKQIKNVMKRRLRM